MYLDGKFPRRKEIALCIGDFKVLKEHLDSWSPSSTFPALHDADDAVFCYLVRYQRLEVDGRLAVHGRCVVRGQRTPRAGCLLVRLGLLVRLRQRQLILVDLAEHLANFVDARHERRLLTLFHVSNILELNQSLLLAQLENLLVLQEF